MVKDKTNATQPQSPDVQRRQLLKGLSAIPVVATLTPVSASALSLACNEKTPPALPSGTSTYEPDASGVQYQCLTPPDAGTAEGYNATVKDPLAGPDTPTAVYTKDTGSAALGDHTDSINPTSRQCVIYLDGGNQLTYQSNAAGGVNPIAASCMMSLGLTQP